MYPQRHECVAFFFRYPIELLGSKAKPFQDPPGSLGDHLRKRRHELGLFQRDAAREIGCATWTYLTWETGKKQPTFPQWPGIIRFLGYDPHLEPVSLGEQLRAAYRRLGLPQKHAARAIGMDPATLYRYEAGDWVPGSDRTRRLLGLLLEHRGTLGELRDQARQINQALPYLDPPVTLGDRLRKRRHELGWTQDRVGQLLGVDRATVGRWETNEALPASGRLSSIEAFLRGQPRR